MNTPLIKNTVLKKGGFHLKSVPPTGISLAPPRPGPSKGFDALVDEMVRAAHQHPANLLTPQIPALLVDPPHLSGEVVSQSVPALPFQSRHQRNRASPHPLGPPTRYHTPRPIERFPFSDPPLGSPAFDTYPLYFYLSSPTSQPLTSRSHLVLSDALDYVLSSTDHQATPMRNGSLLVRAASRHQSQLLASLSYLGDLPVVSTPDDVRNTSKGTVYAPEVRSDDPEAILEHFTKRHIPDTNVYRFPPHKETPTVSNPRLLLTFSVPFPPTRVKIGFTIHSVRPYIPVSYTHLRAHE